MENTTVNTTDKTTSELLALIEKLSIDSVFGVMTRQALEIRWNELTNNANSIVFMDIDNMHKANEEYGYQSVDSRIKNTINNIRSNDNVAARWYSGDEIIFILKSGNAYKFSERIQKELNNNGLSATFGITEVITLDPSETVKNASDKCQNAKKENRRGSIN